MELTDNTKILLVLGVVLILLIIHTRSNRCYGAMRQNNGGWFENFKELNEILKIMNEFYKRALSYEFDLNNRDSSFLIQFEKVIEN